MVVAETSAKNVDLIKQVMLRRARKVLIHATFQGQPAEEAVVAAFVENLESVGYELTPGLIDTCARLSLAEFEQLNDWLMAALRSARGHKPFKPMYPNFPRQVMDASKATLYLNAIRHYFTSGKWLPEFSKLKREGLDERGHMLSLEPGSTDDLPAIFNNLVTANSSLSLQDKEDLRALVKYFDTDIFELIPDTIPNRENKSILLSELLNKGEPGVAAATRLCSTATDVLRLAVAMSDGDVSLAAPCKFRSFKRAERRALLTILEHQKNIQEDMLRWKERWKRLAERLHPLEMERQFPEANLAFLVLRNDLKIVKFNTKIEAAFIEKNVDDLIGLLSARPGDFARRLDHLLRNNQTRLDEIAAAFKKVAQQVSTPVLLQVMHHFLHRPGVSA